MPIGARAQQPDTIVSLVNFYPGGQIFELEGHTALRIRVGGEDIAINYGMFSFEEPGFVYRFVKGETDYWVGMMPWDIFVQHYYASGRRIVEHKLNMTGPQKQRLLALLSDNLRPENATYRYNYVMDNCATRPLRIIEQAMGDTIILGNDTCSLPREASFRDVMRHYHANYPWYQFGIDLALGSGIDYPIDNRQRAFAPVVLDSQMDAATVGGEPLVSESVILNDTAPDEAIEPPTPWYLTPMAVFTLWFLIAALITVRDLRRRRTSRWFDTLLFGAYGLLGLVITYLVCISSHEATSPNWLWAWLNPLCLIAAIGIWIKRAKKLVVCYQIVNFAVLMLLAVAWFALGQCGNVAFIPMVAAEMLRSASYIYIQTRTNPADRIARKEKT